MNIDDMTSNMLDPKWLRFWAKVTSVLTVKAILIVGGFWIGRKLDQHWGTFPLFAFSLIVAMSALSLAWIVWMINHRKF